MKKVSVLFFALLVVSAGITAKELPLSGTWLLTKVDTKGDIQELYSEVNFKSDGYAEMEGRVFGSWSYNKKAKTYIIESEMIAEFSGEWNLTKHGKNEIVLSNTELKLFLVRIDKEKIALDNQESGFIGLWETKNEDGTTYLVFDMPNELSVITISEYSSSNGSGTWMYDKNNESIILMTNDRALMGSKKVVNADSESFEIKKGDQVIKGVKIKQNAKNREKLIFTEEDIANSHDNSETDVSLEATYIAWLNPETKLSYLKTVNKLIYTHSTLLADLDAFTTDEIITNVVYDENYEQIIIDQTFGELSTPDYSYDNIFYPMQELDRYDYRVTGNESIKVPAGTFDCTVIEAVTEYGRLKLKYYLITNRPGVYAKVIAEQEDNYEMYELMKIENSSN